MKGDKMDVACVTSGTQIVYWNNLEGIRPVASQRHSYYDNIKVGFIAIRMIDYGLDYLSQCRDKWWWTGY
jgi:hypothetical protein